MENFEEIRKTFVWGSFGKKHDEGVKATVLKDISDSHLLHIIPWVEKGNYDDDILYIFKSEQMYRMEHYIFVPEYQEVNKNSTYRVEPPVFINGRWSVIRTDSESFSSKKVVYKGTLADCNAYIQLIESGHLTV